MALRRHYFKPTTIQLNLLTATPLPNKMTPPLKIRNSGCVFLCSLTRILVDTRQDAIKLVKSHFTQQVEYFIDKSQGGVGVGGGGKTISMQSPFISRGIETFNVVNSGHSIKSTNGKYHLIDYLKIKGKIISLVFSILRKHILIHTCIV